MPFIHSHTFHTSLLAFIQTYAFHTNLSPFIPTYRHKIMPTRQHIITSCVFILVFSSLERHLAGHEVIICPASSRECLKFSLNVLRALNTFQPLASEPACFGMSFPPFLVKQFYRCYSFVISWFMRTRYVTRSWGWLWGRLVYKI